MDLIIYPQNWIHNANVYGFLKVIHNSEEKLSFSLEDILMDDGTIVLTDRIQDELYQNVTFDGRDYPKLFVLLLEETKRMNDDDLEKAYSHFKGQFGYYENFIAKYLKKEERQKFLDELSRVIKKIFVKPRLEGDETCFFCGNKLSTEGIEDIENQRKFSRVLFKSLSSSENKFPNTFWNMSNKYYLCEICSQMALFRHFVFPRDEGIFINVPSFKAIWYLNEAYRAHKRLVGLSEREELVLSRVVSDVSIKLQRLLGVWERQNVEIVSISGETFRTYYLPADVVDLLLNTFVSSILNALNNNEIFALIVQRRFSEILDLEHLILKAIEKNDKSLRDVLSEKWKISESNLELYSELLPELFSSIRSVQGVSTLLTPYKIRELRELGRSMARSFERTRYRLLELIRLGKREEVYHILLRTYMASNVTFPEKLNEVFTYEDEDFKNAMFAYVSGMTLEREEEETGGEEE